MPESEVPEQQHDPDDGLWSVDTNAPKHPSRPRQVRHRVRMAWEIARIEEKIWLRKNRERLADITNQVHEVRLAAQERQLNDTTPF
jgi:hypothetical protein